MMVRIGLPKGNLINKSKKVIETLLNDKYESKNLNGHNENFEFYLLKHRDIPRLLNDGYIDIGITSTEWIVETTSSLIRLADLDWCNTRISLISDNKKVLYNKKITCATEFPHIADIYFKALGINYSIYKLSGSSEAGVPNLFDTSIDCVETGETLKNNNLYEIDVIMNSNISVYTNNPNYLDNNNIMELIECLKSM